MKLCLLICVAFAGASGERPGHCPEPFGTIGLCVFIPGVNCLQDSECDSELKCCPEGCGSVCRVPVEVHAGSCPGPSGTPGPCEILPNSCSSDSSCAPDEKCCLEVCDKVCKKAVKPFEFEKNKFTRHVNIRRWKIKETEDTNVSRVCLFVVVFFVLLVTHSLWD